MKTKNFLFYYSYILMFLMLSFPFYDKNLIIIKEISKIGIFKLGIGLIVLGPIIDYLLNKKESFFIKKFSKDRIPYIIMVAIILFFMFKSLHVI